MLRQKPNNLSQNMGSTCQFIISNFLSFSPTGCLLPHLIHALPVPPPGPCLCPCCGPLRAVLRTWAPSLGDWRKRSELHGYRTRGIEASSMAVGPEEEDTRSLPWLRVGGGAEAAARRGGLPAEELLHGWLHGWWRTKWLAPVQTWLAAAATMGEWICVRRSGRCARWGPWCAPRGGGHGRGRREGGSGDNWSGPQLIGGDTIPPSFEGRWGVFCGHQKKGSYWGTA